jgi:pimeloyl-ACP methyl ester carboxylesterase
MPLAYNENIKINYRVDGEGHPIILLHGLMSNLNSWYDGFAQELLRDYKVVAIDIRGFGKSSKPHNSEEYDPKLLVEDILAVIDKEKIHEATILGYSMGGMVAFECLKIAPKRFVLGVIGGTHLFPSPYRKELLKNMNEGFKNGFDYYFQRVEERVGSIDEETKKSLLENDLEAVIAFNTKWLSISYSTEDEVKKITNPVLLFVGSLDEPIYEEVKRMSTILPNCNFLEVENANHPQALNKDVVVPKVREFLKKKRN